MADLILHHYDLSPFAHKARLVMGLKGLAWKSVEIPMVMPKPDLMPLTGGYRKTPVLQIGADIYFDTSLIAEVLEARAPTPSLFPGGTAGHAAALTAWADQNLFLPCVNYTMSLICDRMPADFFADRAAMRGEGPPDLEKLKAAGPRLLAQTRQQLAVVETMLADGRAYLMGDEPGLADFAVYHPIWMMRNSGRRAAATLEPWPLITAWAERIDAIGEGAREELDAKEALTVAKAAEPTPSTASIDDPDAPAVGARVTLQTADRAPEPVRGEVVSVGRHEIAIKREDPAIGTVAVHAPRAGFIVRPAT